MSVSPIASAVAQIELKRLEAKQASARAITAAPETALLREKILSSGLLPHQQTFCDDQSTLQLAMVAGFGAGKSYGGACKTILLALENQGYVGAYFEPTAPMLRDIALRTFEEVLEKLGIEWRFRASPLPEITLLLPQAPTTILLRTFENYQRIRGQNLAFAIADEIDTCRSGIAQNATNMILARLRSGNVQQFCLTSTPEGYGFLYNWFVEKPADDKRLIHARTTDNPHLPQGFIDSLYANYPSNLIASYINGEFTNLTQHSVYPEFDRDLNASTLDLSNWSAFEHEHLHIGVDFNVGFCAWVVVLHRGREFHVIKFGAARDTPQLIEQWQQEFQPWIDSELLTVYPDASARNRSTEDAGQSDLRLIRDAGLSVAIQKSNPLIRDRVLTVNTLVKSGTGDRRLLVHSECGQIIKVLEQHAYDPRTGQPEKGDGGETDLSGPADALGYVLWALAGLKGVGRGGTARDKRGRSPVRLY